MLTEGRVLWCDAEANCERMADRAGVAEIVRKAKRARINTLVVDVKPLIGEVLYTSRVAPRLGEVKGFRYPEDFDLLRAMIEEGHAAGLRVHANINVFSEGHREFAQGPGFAKPDWQVVTYEVEWRVTIGDTTVRAEALDRPNLAEPVILTARTTSLPRDESRAYVTVQGDRVVRSAVGDYAPPPADGCVIALPSADACRARVGDLVTFESKPIFRPMAESKLGSYGLFVNPVGAARQYELEIVREIVGGYEIDGIIFDRMRYPNLQGDFSELSRERFASWLGAGDLNWPDDIYRISDRPWQPNIEGRYYREWLQWRAQQITDFAGDAAALSRSLRPEARVSVYVGSWYEGYYHEGVNWGSRNYHAGCSWMTPEYNRTGYAEIFDFICTGCYYPIATRDEARALGRPEGATVEAACEQSRRAIMDAAPFYGSLYLRDYAGNPEGFLKAAQAALNSSDGVMLFDLVYLEDYEWWPLLEGMLTEDAVAPHDIQG